MAELVRIREDVVSIRNWGICLVVLVAATAATVRADSWLPPKTLVVVSPNGNWRLTIEPRAVASPLAYFQDKVDQRPNAGAVEGDRQTSAIGRMEHREDGRWRIAWTQPLGNEVSPVDAMASDTGQAVTFDNWHGMGFGSNAIAIYDAEGRPVRAMGLADFLPEEYVDALPHSVSSIHWRGEPRFSSDGRQVIVPVVVPSVEQETADEESVEHIDVHVELADGQLVPSEGPEWSRALASAHKAYRKLKQDQAEARERFVSPLAAPVDGDEPDWHAYLSEAFFRIDADWEDGYPATEVIPLPMAANFALVSGYLGDALTDEMNADGVIMLASPSQDVLVDVLETQAKRVKSGALSQARIYVATDARHIQRARDALAHTGAQVLQLDINQTIPQRKARLDAYLSRGKVEDPG